MQEVQWSTMMVIVNLRFYLPAHLMCVECYQGVWSLSVDTYECPMPTAIPAEHHVPNLPKD